MVLVPRGPVLAFLALLYISFQLGRSLTLVNTVESRMYTTVDVSV